MNKWQKRILIVIISIVLNVAGRYLAFYFEWPMYFNLCGTILSSYLIGPVAGIIATELSGALSLIFSSTDWQFLIADIFVAAAAGIIAKRNRYFEKFYLIFSATVFFSVVRTPVLLMIHLSTNDGKSGLYIVDAIVDYMDSISAPLWLGYVLVAIFISFTDTLVAMLLIYFIIRISKSFGKRKKASELKKELMKRITFTAIAIAVFISAFSNKMVLADNHISFVEKLYNSYNGLIGGCVNDIAMTRDGSMWIATYGGLFRFNGSKFILIDNLNSVRSVQSLFVDEEDRLWAGTQDSGVTLLNIDMTWRTLDMNTGLPSNSVKCISRDSNGMYYFGTTGGLVTAVYDNGEVKVIKSDTKAGNIRDLSPDAEGHMFVMNNLGKVSCYENGNCISELYLQDVSVKGISYDNNGIIYIGTDFETILKYEFSSGSFVKKGSMVADNMKTIRDFYLDNDILYIAADNGIGYIDKSEHFNLIESGDFNNSIDHILKDYQGNLWYTSARCGLLCLGKSSFIDIFKLCNEKSVVCNAVKDWNGHLYVGTNKGLKILDVSNGNSIKNEITDVFDNIRVRSMSTDSSGNLLVATYDKGLMEISLNGDVSEYINPDETGKAIRFVYTLSNGTVISSSDTGIVFMKDHEVSGKLNISEDLIGASVLNILEIDEDTLLFGTDGDGIAVIRDQKLDRYITHEDGLPSGVVLRVVADDKSGGYFVMTGSGICYMDDSFNTKEIGMPYYNNFDITVNKEGEVFVLGGAGIYISDYESIMNTGMMDRYTLLDNKSGLPGSITSNAWNYVTDDELLYICGASGVYLLDLNDYEMKIEDFKTKITSIRRDGEYEDVTEVGTILIPKDTERIELDLEINNFTSADPNICFFLSGVDEKKTIVRASKLGSVTYYDIPYGNHDFVISVIDDKGRELSKQVYIFSKERELFETVGFTLYFYLVLFAFIVFIIISIVQGALWSQRKRESGRHELVVSKLEREKSEALERALHLEENTNKSKTEFLANLSHEIRTPINAILGMDTMIMRESHEQEIKNYARNINVAGKTLLTLVNDVLDFSNIESGRLELVLGEYDLSAMINGIINMISPNVYSKKLDFEVLVNPDIPNRLYGDEVRIEQIIINILTNAVKYTEKGKVTFKVDFEQDESGSILLNISVKDTGIGIKAEDIEKLFLPYERLEKNSKRSDGTGLGMSITKDLLEKMGSHLEVSSAYGKGSEFSFSIRQTVRDNEKIGDYHNNTEEDNALFTNRERYHAPDAKLLIVDEIEVNLTIVRNLLKRIKVQVDTVQSGEEAIMLAKDNQYDIIILDSMMPGLDGEDTMQSIRTECTLNKETPIIVLTSHVMNDAREEYLRLGYTNYLSKPLDGIKLESMIECYLPDEKIIYVDSDAVENDGILKEDAVLSKISKIEGIDSKTGIEISGGKDSYIVICRNYYDTAKSQISIMKEAYTKDNFESLKVQLRSLINSARLVGAVDLVDHARKTEVSLEDGDVEQIRKDIGILIDKYEWLYKVLGEIFV